MGLRICVSSELPGDAAAAGLGLTLRARTLEEPPPSECGMVTLDRAPPAKTPTSPTHQDPVDCTCQAPLSMGFPTSFSGVSSKSRD